MYEKLEEYLLKNSIKFIFESNSIVTIENFGTFLIIEPKGNVLITSSFNLNLSEEEINAEVDYYCFRFGEGFYYTKRGDGFKLTPLKYLGEYDNQLDLSIPFIGLHGFYEILNGSRDYKDWIKKAKFLNIDTLGICEKNTLAGVLKFQLACNKEKIKSIIGEQIVIKEKEEFLQVKCYVKNSRGWTNLLLINKEINIVNRGFITKEAFLKLIDGLFIVIDTKYSDYGKILPLDLNIPELYYQIDTVEYIDQEKDKEYLLNLKKFVSQKSIKPVLICDAYYLDNGDAKAKDILNMISNVRDYKSKNQYFKSIEENFEILSGLFKDEEKCFSLFEESITNLLTIVNNCEFEIKTGVKFLPKYIMTKEEVEKYKTRDNMFWSLIDDGLKRINKESDTKYSDRVKEEYEVIKQVTSNFGDGIDYFLILWDVIRWCNENNILVGLGRGSSSGSIISYLLDITKLDPFDYGLLFSRFLNVGRVENGALPDIDSDFEALRRDDVKRYIEGKYGQNHVCSVGTYTTLQLKAALKDISRQRNIEFGTVNYISQLLDVEDGDWDDIFMTALSKKQVKDFIGKYPDVIEDIQLILKQPKSNSIHACATIITPDDKEIFEYFPVRLGEKNDEEMIVSEWEGGELEIAGFLKEDILGIKQLDKYRFIIDLIKKELNEDIDIYSIPVDVNEVYELFQKGFNGDIFHFGSKGLTGYCKEVRPNSIHELIDTISLYRPGAMDVNAHNEYVLRKFGDREVSYPWRTEEILKNTYGLIVYQEQVMKIVQQLADFDLVTADDIRRAMGKKKKDIIDKYKDQFINKVINKGCKEDEAKDIWHELEVHSRYSFNMAHAAAYAITGYIGQWLKYYYPLQYWTSAFQFDDPNPKKSNINRFISEINRTDNFINIMPPMINESSRVFTSNYQKMELYWSIDKVRQLGDKALEAIIGEREKNGEFFSLEEFLNRVEKRVVNKAVVINLILSGAFDTIEDIKFEGERKRLINKYYEYTGSKRDKEDIYLDNHENYWWQIKQKELSGFGIIDYETVLKTHTKFKHDYTDGLIIQDSPLDREVVAIGMIKDFNIRTTKRDVEFCSVVLDNNNENIDVTIWSETFINVDNNCLEVGKILAISGKVAQYRGNKSVHSFEKSELYFL